MEQQNNMSSTGIVSKIEELTSCAKVKSEYFVAIEKAEKKARRALKTANEAASEETGFLNTNAVRHLQLACIEMSNALISQSESQKKAFENQKKMAGVIRYLFTISINNMASYRKVISDLNGKISELSNSPEDEKLKKELLSIINQFRSHEDILLHIEKQDKKINDLESRINKLETSKI